MIPRKHIVPAGFGLIALIVLSTYAMSGPSLASVLGKTVVDIGVEHEKPLSLTMEVGVNGKSGMIEFFTETDENILISVPSTWIRREVWNAPIETVTSEPPSLGLSRWTLPPRSGISFTMRDAPDSVILHNPTGVQMKLNLTYIDVVSDTVKREVVLIQEDTKKLW